MPSRARTIAWVTGLVATVAVAAEGTPTVVMRRERQAAFSIDPEFQRKGGVQYFYELLRSDALREASPTFATWKTFDMRGRFDARSLPLHVVMGRVSYVLDKDISFFSEKQVRDVGYIATIADGFGISQTKDGTYRTSSTPSNAFRITYFDRAAVAREATDGGIAQLRALQPDAGLPTVVVLQENYDFARVLGVRTGDYSYTWTAHYPLGPGRTLLDVCTMSYIYTAPPFFLGGDARIAAESLEGTRTFIRALRAYPPDAGAP